MTFILSIVHPATVAMYPDVGIGAGTRMVANGAGVRGVAGLNATVWIEDRAAKVCIDDFDGASEVWMDAQVCAICTCGGGIATERTRLQSQVPTKYLNGTTKVWVIYPIT